MQVLDVAISFAAVLALCVFLTLRCRLPGALAPVLALGFAILFCTVAGLVGLLWPGTLLFYLLCFALGAFALSQKNSRARLGELLAPGLGLFVALGLVCLVYFAVRQPQFAAWDEYSFWGISVKLLKQDNALYTGADMGWAWTATQSPALPILGYFAQFFGAFAPWKVYWADSLLLFACIAALLGGIERAQWRLWLPAGVLGLLLPYWANVTGRLVYFDNGYLSSYGDLPAGFLFGACLAVYFMLRREQGGRWLFALVPLAAFSLTKDNVIPIVLVAAGLMAADLLLFPRQRGGVAKRLAGCAGLFAAPLAAYLAWSRHAAAAAALNAGEGGDATTHVSQLEGILSTLKQLTGLEEKTERFARTLPDFAGAYFDGSRYPVSAFGSGFVNTVIILLVFAVAVLLLTTKRQRLRCALCGGLSLLGFAGYQFVLLVSYGFLFKTEGLVDYTRYQTSYYLGWLMLALVWLGFGLAARAKASVSSVIFIRAGTLLVCAAGLVWYARWVPAPLSVLAYPDASYARQTALAAIGADIQGYGKPGDKVFIVCQQGNGQQWLEHSYNLLPLVLDYSITGGGTLYPPQPGHPEEDSATLAELAAYLENNEIDLILVDTIDDGFVQAYAALSTDALSSVDDGRIVLYQRTENGLYQPVQEWEKP